jgi:hypothetical protein
MPICGFNQKMLNGLRDLHEGLVEHGIIERSTIREQSVNETLQRELSDMSRFLGETNSLANPQIRELTEALTKYAKAFYTLIGKQGIGNYRETIGKINGFFVEMDRKYYDELEGKTDDMKQLVEHLNGVEV